MEELELLRQRLAQLQAIQNPDIKTQGAIYNIKQMIAERERKLKR